MLFSSNPRKHSQRNAELTGEFVFNLATFELRHEMNQTSYEYPDGTSEPETVGLEMVPSRVVKPPRVKRSPIALECIFNKHVELVRSSGETMTASVTIGEVVSIYIADDVIVDGFVDLNRIRPIARLGYMDYCVVDTIFTMPRPSSA